MKKIQITLAIFSLLSLILITGTLRAQDYWFKTNGPLGGSVHSVVFGIGNSVYVGTELKGIFKSSDAGQTWVQSGLDGYTINSIFIDSANRIFASRADGGLFRSTDIGQNWAELTYDFGNSIIYDMIGNPTGRFFVGTENGVFATDNGGDDWDFYSDDLPGDAKVYSLAVALDSMVYTGTNTGVYRSDNNGNNWNVFNNLLSTTTVTSLVVDSNKYVFAGTLTNGIFFSSDSGKSWTARNSGIGNYYITSIVIDSLNHLYISVFDNANGGIYKSTNLGISWTKVGASLLTRYPLALDVSKNNVIAGTDDIGVILSLDLGASWAESNNGILNSHINSLLFISDSILIAAHQGGIAKTSDFGYNWLNRNSGLGNRWVNSLVQDNNAMVYAATEGGVYISDDLGETWLSKNLGLGNLNVQSLAVDNSNSILAGTQNGIYRLNDIEGSWQFLDLPGLIIKSIVIASEGIILAGTDNFGVYKSTDNGLNWTNDNNGLTSQVITDFELLPDGSILASTLGFGVFLSNDLGDSWVARNSGLSDLNVNNVANDPLGNLFAATENGCFISTNQGSTWSQQDDGLDSNWLTSFTVHKSGHVFNGTFGDGVYYTSAPIISELESNTMIYTEGSGLQFITDSLAISDLNSKNMSWAEVQIIENFDPLEDSLSFENSVLITGNYDSRTGLMTLSGNDTKVNYENAIRSVLYINTNTLHREDISKKISFVVNDAYSTSNILTRDITVRRVNEPPSISNVPDVSFKANESDTLLVLPYISDADHDLSQVALDYEIIDFQSHQLRSKNSSFKMKDKKPDEILDIDDLDITIDYINKILYFNATPDSGGVFTVELRVTDPDLSSDVDTIIVDIERLPVYINNPPIVHNPISNYSFYEDSGNHIVVQDIRDVIIDVDPGDELTFELSNSNESINAEIVDFQIIVSALKNYYGTGNFTLTATDTSGESVSDEFSITVINVNDAPVVLQIPAVVFEEDETYNDLDLDNYVYDIDNPIDVLEWYITFPNNIVELIQKHFDGKNSNSTVHISTIKYISSDKVDEKTIAKDDEEISFGKIQLFEITAAPKDSLTIAIDTLTHVVTVSATPNFTELNIPVAFSAMDPSFDIDTDTTSISVLPINDPPVILGFPTIEVNEDDSLAFSVSSWRGFVYDIDNSFEQLDFSLADTLENIIIEAIDDSTRIIKAKKDWFGVESILIKVSDGIDSVFSYVNFLFHSVNDKPEIFDIPENVTFPNDSSVQFYMFDLVDDIETADSLLSFEFSTDNDSLTYRYYNDTGIIRITSTNHFSGYADLTMRVFDDSSAFADTTIHFYVEQKYFPVLIPDEYLLEQNYPNPFNPGTTIKFDLPVDSEVKIQLYNSIGERIGILHDGVMTKGYKSIMFYGGELSSGVYFYSIYARSLDKTKDYFSVKKMMFLK
ncbi:MAG: hypothetical protein V1720_07145 [bacterium]